MTSCERVGFIFNHDESAILIVCALTTRKGVPPEVLCVHSVARLLERVESSENCGVNQLCGDGG